MYIRNYDDAETMQSFRRSDYTIPANYSGNVFTADEPPLIDDETTQKKEQCLDCEAAADETLCDTCKEKIVGKSCNAVNKNEEGGLLRGLFSRIERGFDFDDLLLIGLIILLIRENKESGQKNDEIVILLAILLLSGF